MKKLVHANEANSYLFKFVLIRYKTAVLIFILGLIASLSTFLLTLLIGDFFVLHFNLDTNKGKLLEMAGIRLQNHSSYFIIFALVLLLKGVAQYFEKFIGELTTEDLIKQLRGELFSAQLQTDQEQFNKTPLEKYLLNYNNDLKGVRSWFSKGLLFVGKDIAFISLGILMISWIDPNIATAIFLSFITLGLFVFGISRKQLKSLAEKRRRKGNLMSFIARSMRRLNRQRSSEDLLLIEWTYAQKTESSYTANRSNLFWESLTGALIPILPFVMIGVILLQVTTEMVSLSGSEGMVIILFLLLMQGAIRRLLRVPSLWHKGHLSISKLLVMIADLKSVPAQIAENNPKVAKESNPIAIV